MGKQEEKNTENPISIGILAHVDAGKTTLAESLLYLSGAIRTLGRVDHGDTYLDTYGLERERGITIFSKQARLSAGDKNITLLDTPGHGDFSAEMERTLQVLDYAILVISGADGVQSHVETLWKLLKRYEIPVFLFINKMDQQGTDKAALLAELKERLSENCVDFDKNQNREDFLENLAVCDETVMEHYLSQGEIPDSEIQSIIKERKVFPCFFGSALKLTGVEELIQGISLYTEYKVYPEEFGARVYKIARDVSGNRLTYLKVTGGILKVKDLLCDPQGQWQEKADQIRLYSGEGFEVVREAGAGTICAVTGLTQTFAGQGLGSEKNINLPVLEPVLSYRIVLPKDCSPHKMLSQLRQLEEEEPLLHIVWREEVAEIHAQLMGEVQIEVLKTMIQQRYGVEVEFASGSIVYKETILEPVEGVGHFEPLRHYAEVHLLLEPAEQGSGLSFFTTCSEDVLDKNWQRLILTHLEEKHHIGVLTGSEITDMKITLLTGRAHQKHTEGGDFRQATYRALRQGLKIGKCRLLEPMYQYRLEIPSQMVGRAMTDIQNMHGKMEAPQQQGEMAVITGTAPVATMQGYQIQVLAYSQGKGRLSCSFQGYGACHNEEEVIEAIGYDSQRDLENPTGSVFCAHGAGFVVDYDQVYDYMHVEGVYAKKNRISQEVPEEKNISHTSSIGSYDEKELETIFKRTYGDVKQQRKGWNKRVVHQSREPEQEKAPGRNAVRDGKEYLLVDGYNIIFGWEELNELAKVDLQAARNALMDILCNYQGYKKNILILVFDAYKVAGNPGSTEKYHNIHVVYTKEAETADQYIEKVTHEIGRKHKVTVATSDALEQMIIMGQGAQRISAKGLLQEIESTNTQIRSELTALKTPEGKHYLREHLPKLKE